MRAVVQRVARAVVSVDGETLAAIGSGLLVYLGVAPRDTPEVAEHLAQRLALLRVFPDGQGKMNHSLLEVRGCAMVISQFTLFADNRSGHRPSFTDAGSPEKARELCRRFAAHLRQLGVVQVGEGKFGAHMVVESVNDGPVTIVTTSSEAPWSADSG